MTTGRGDIQVGAPVFAQDGTQLGEVKEVRGRYFKVDAPMQKDYWLSMDAVSSATSGQITLAVDSGRLDDYKASDPGDFDEDTTRAAAGTAGTAGTYTGAATGTTGATASGTRGWDETGSTYRQNWEQQYGTSGRRWDDAEPGYRYGHEMASEERYRGREWNDAETDLRSGYSSWAQGRGYRASEGGWDRVREGAREAWDRVRGTGQRTTEVGTRGTAERVTDEGGRRVELREEELRAQTQPVEAGEVGIRKEVVTEQRTMDVPVTREEVEIQRRPVEARPSDRPIGEGEEIRVPVREEQVTVEKQPVVREEIELGKRQVQDTERVTGEVRREEARIEREGDVDVRGEGTEGTRRDR